MFNSARRLLTSLVESHEALKNPEQPETIVMVTKFLNEAADVADIIKRLEGAN